MFLFIFHTSIAQNRLNSINCRVFQVARALVHYCDSNNNRRPKSVMLNEVLHFFNSHLKMLFLGIQSALHIFSVLTPSINNRTSSSNKNASRSIHSHHIFGNGAKGMNWNFVNLVSFILPLTFRIFFIQLNLIFHDGKH